jgi:regulator of protease activity HflC (stomatin/prohibitin superfamily)
MVFLIAVIILILTSTIKVLREWERGVILRLGKFHSVRGPGIIIVIPLIERMFRINTRLVTVDVPPQDIITKDTPPFKKPRPCCATCSAKANSMNY